MATFNNTATLTYNGKSISSNTTTGELVQVLSASKTAVDSTYSPGDVVTYAVNLVNSGTTPLSALTLTDNLGAYTPSGLSDTVTPLTYVDGSVKYFINGALQTALTPSATDPLTVTGISVPAGGNTSVLYSATVNSYAPPSSGGTVENTAAISGTGLTEAVTADETITADSTPQLAISKALSPTTVADNGTVTYTIAVQNSGNTAIAASDDVVVSDTFNPVLSSLTATLNGTPLTSSQYSYDTSTGVFAITSGELTVPAATSTQDPTTGEYTVTPGVSTLVITGTI